MLTYTIRRKLRSGKVGAVIGLVLVAVVVVCGVFVAGRGRTTSIRDRVASLQRDSIAVRSIDAADDDFRDLAALADILAGRRFVLIPELTHADGGTFAARTRLTRFLHEQLGFNVVCDEWSAPGLDRLSRNMSTATAFRKFLADKRNSTLTERRYASQRHLYEYVQATQSTDHPMKLMGCSVYYMSDGQLWNEFRKFFDDAGASAELGEASWARLREVLTPLTDGSWPKEKPTEVDVEQVAEIVKTLRARIRNSRNKFVDAHGADRMIYVDCLLESLPAFVLTATMDEPHDPRIHAKQLEERDRAMANLIIRAAKERFPDEKFVIMAARWHLLRMSPDRGGFAATVPGMGEFLYREFGNQVYTIAFEPYSGNFGYAGGQTHSLPPASVGSLAELLHQAGGPYRYLDFTRLPADHWLRHERVAGRADPLNAIWPNVAEGVFFIDEERAVAGTD